MPYQDPEKQREYQKEQMRRRREAQKAAEPGIASVPKSVEHPATDQLNDNLPAAASNSESPAVPLIKSDYQIAKETAERTKELLETRGWVLWKCSKLNNEVIVIIRDEWVTGYPPGLPFFTDAELREFNRSGISLMTYKLLIEARKEDAKVLA